MAPFDFPATPAPGEVYTPANGPSYQWDGEKWKGGGQAREPDEQFFDLSGLTQRDIVVPTWAKGVQLIGSVFVLASAGAMLRVSADGTNFFTGASDYIYAGSALNTGTALYQSVAQATGAGMYLCLAGDNTAVAQQFDAVLNVVRDNAAGQVFTLKADGRGRDAGATILYRGWHGTGFVQTATTSALALKALRVLMSSGGAFGPGSWLRVKWLGDTGQLKVGTSVPDANTDGKLYGRKDNAWIEASPRPQSAAGIGQWVSLAANGVALVLPAGGTWAWFFGGTNTGSGAVTSAFSGGVSAGGTQLAAGAAGTYWQGFAWRIA